MFKGSAPWSLWATLKMNWDMLMRTLNIPYPFLSAIWNRALNGIQSVIAASLFHRMPGVHGRCWVQNWYRWCRGFNQSCLSIATMVFAMDGYKLSVNSSSEYLPEYRCVSKSHISHVTQLLGVSKRELRKLKKTLETKTTKQSQKISEIFRPKRNISFLVMIGARSDAIRTGTPPIQIAGYWLLDTCLPWEVVLVA